MRERVFARDPARFAGQNCNTRSSLLGHLTVRAGAVNTVHVLPRRARKTAARTSPSRHVQAFSKANDDTRALLVAAARDVFLETGQSGFSLREVARRVGVSAAAVYRHFDGKEALLFAACTQGFQIFSGYLVRALAAPSPRERLLDASEAYLAFALENALDYRFIFMSTAAEVNPTEAHASARERGALPQDTTFRFLVDRVRECIAAGVLAPGEAERIAVVIWCHVHGIVSLRIAGHLGEFGESDDFAGFYRESVAHLLRALGR